MATPLDLQEQEQLDELKAFWKQYGNLITWTLTIALGGFAAYNGWLMYQRDQATKAGTMYSELEAAVQAGDADRAGRVFGDMKDRFARTTYAAQAGLVAAKLQADKGKPEAALASLQWVAEHGGDEHAALARLREAALLLDAKKYADALAQLDAVKLPAYAALVADRRGDVLMAQGQKDAAKAAYQAAWDGMDAAVKYRFVVETKLTALGAAPAASSAASAPDAGAAR